MGQEQLNLNVLVVLTLKCVEEVALVATKEVMIWWTFHTLFKLQFFKPLGDCQCSK